MPKATHKPAMSATRLRRSAPVRAIPAIPALAALPSGIAGAQARLSDPEVFFELNSTARDVGLHASFEAEGWKSVRIEGPGGRRVSQVRAEGPSRQIAITELRFEGEEPNVREVSFSHLRTLFPPGRHLLRGTTVGNRTLRGADKFTAKLPCPTRITAPTEDSMVPVEDLTVRWTAPSGVFDPGTRACDRRRDVGLAGFQVTVEFENAGIRRIGSFRVRRQ